MEMRVNFEYNGKIYPIIIKKRKQSNVVIRYNGVEFLISAPKSCTKALILQTAKPTIVKIIEGQKYDLHTEKEGVSGLYILGEYKKIDDGFIDVLGHQVLFQNLDDFYRRITPIIYPLFDKYFRECEKATNSQINHQLKLVHVQGYFGQNHTKKHIIKINVELIHYKEDAIKSVMYHELAHDYVLAHNQEFYAKLKEFDTFYKEHRQIVNKKQYERSLL